MSRQVKSGLIRYISPLVYIVSGSLGFYSFISVFCVLDYKPPEHPYSHPFFVIAGSISLILCIVAFMLDIYVYSREVKKLRRFVFEFLGTLVLFVTFLFVWGLLDGFVSEQIIILL